MLEVKMKTVLKNAISIWKFKVSGFLESAFKRSEEQNV